jgi:hypothetical protein
MTGISVCVLQRLKVNCYVADGCNLAWCDGLGMLIILLALVYIALFYYFIIKTFCGKTLYNNVFKPLYKCSNILLERRYTTMIFCMLSLYLGYLANFIKI